MALLRAGAFCICVALGAQLGAGFSVQSSVHHVDPAPELTGEVPVHHVRHPPIQSMLEDIMEELAVKAEEHPDPKERKAKGNDIEFSWKVNTRRSEAHLEMVFYGNKDCVPGRTNRGSCHFPAENTNWNMSLDFGDHALTYGDMLNTTWEFRAGSIFQNLKADCPPCGDTTGCIFDGSALHIPKEMLEFPSCPLKRKLVIDHIPGLAFQAIPPFVPAFIHLNLQVVLADGEVMYDATLKMSRANR
mmetsp:Transcript_14320/g.32559  ORF Transcript_14320/g.32559 Transcript_14320/m.32559 type:complete len:245 (-) Transcript_14320:103-837(-)